MEKTQTSAVSILRRAASGAILIAIGAAIIGISWRYPFGTLTQMGPGYVPFYCGLGILALGLVILMSDLRAEEVASTTPPRWRAFLFVTASITLFALLVNWLGLVPAMFMAVTVSMLADEDASLGGILIYATVMTGLGWLLFIKALGLPLTAFLV